MSIDNLTSHLPILHLRDILGPSTYVMRFLILTQYFEPEIGAPQVRFKSLFRI